MCFILDRFKCDLIDCWLKVKGVDLFYPSISLYGWDGYFIIWNYPHINTVYILFNNIYTYVIYLYIVYIFLRQPQFDITCFLLLPHSAQMRKTRHHSHAPRILIREQHAALKPWSFQFFYFLFFSTAILNPFYRDVFYFFQDGAKECSKLFLLSIFFLSFILIVQGRANMLYNFLWPLTCVFFFFIIFLSKIFVLEKV